MLFRAVDADTGRPVGLRRFFPFGIDGGGLEAQEVADYQRGVAEMAALNHPALRAVLTGGCDPVDGFPYLVTEWVEGESLATLLGHGEFEPDAVVEVIERALKLCETISAKLGVEAMWLETSPELVVLDGNDAGRGFTFGLSPVRWLVESRDRHSLLPLAVLAEEMMGWRGRLVGDQAGGGLGGWIKWLRNSPPTVTLAEARRTLARMTGREVPEPEFVAMTVPSAPVAAPPVGVSGLASDSAVGGTRTTVAPVVMPLALPAQRSSKPLWAVVAILAVLVAGVGWWVVKHPRVAAAAAEAVPPSESVEAKRLAEINARAAKLVEGGAVQEADLVFKADDRQGILNEDGKRISVEGKLLQVRASKSGKTLYLEFSDEAQADQVRGRVVVKDAGRDLSEDALKRWIGKQVRITGVVEAVKTAGVTRPEVTLEDGASIKEVP